MPHRNHPQSANLLLLGLHLSFLFCMALIASESSNLLKALVVVVSIVCASVATGYNAFCVPLSCARSWVHVPFSVLNRIALCVRSWEGFSTTSTVASLR